MQDLLGLPPQGSAHAHEIDSSIALIHWLMIVLFVGWTTFYLYSLIRFRKARNPRADYTGLRSRLPYVVVGAVAVFELVVLAGFDLPLWARLIADIPAEKDATVIRVVGEQFAWNVHYPGPDGIFGRTDISLVSAENPLGLDRNDPAAKDDITTINQLNLPVGKPVIVRLSSKDVIHSFGIPYFRVKQDAIPGQTVRVTFTPIVTSEEMQSKVARQYHIDRATNAEQFTVFVSMEDYKDKDGGTILAKGDNISQDALGKLLDAGITELHAGPYSPIEVACSQLCGLGHFRMRATINIQTQDQYEAWLKEQASYLTQ